MADKCGVVFKANKFCTRTPLAFFGNHKCGLPPHSSGKHICDDPCNASGTLVVKKK